jgi:8-oxo-dGTP diphosphatase
MPGDNLNQSSSGAQTGAVACGVAVVLTHRCRVLVGKRKLESGGFEWQLPGGWIEPGESPEQAARREVREETGLRLQALRFVGITNNIFSAHNHTISLYFESECADLRSLRAGEDGKCCAWEWRDWADLTENLYLPLRLFRQTHYQPFENRPVMTYVSF